MSFFPLISIAGATLGSLALKVASQLPKSPSFADVMRRLNVDSASEPNASGIIGHGLTGSSSTAVESIRMETEDALRQFRKQLLDRFAAAGIDTTQPIHLQGDGYGRVIVAGDHPNRVAIEAILSQDPNLTELFNYLSANYRVLQSRRTSHAGTPHFNSLRELELQPESSANIDAAEFNIVIDGSEFHASFQQPFPLPLGER